MNRTIYNYRFDTDLPMDAIKGSLLLAVMAVEGLKGRARVQLEARFKLNKNKRSCEIEANTDVGESIARIFTGFLVKEFGENAFKVERLISSKDMECACNETETSSASNHENP